MRTSFLIAIAALLVAGFAFSQLPRTGVIARSPDNPGGKASGSRFYCDRSAIPPNQLSRKIELGRLLRSSIRRTRELPDGFEFELGSGPASFQDAAEWAGSERLCCPFFDISLQLTREKGPTFLRLTGETGVKQFIQAEFGPEWFPNSGETPVEPGEQQ
ncbi:MAG: hypothetical protein LAO03_15635 [Acidobacteriia bacterium]|nr:hypothetical protein [Terriglobia bacterium]